MAVEWQLKDDEEEKLDNGQTSSSTGAGGLTSGQAQAPTGKGTASGSYVPLQRYLEANQGRDFGSQVGAKLQDKASQGLSQLSDREGQYRTEVGQGTLDFNDDLANKISQDPTSLSDDEKSQAQKVRTGSYSGPQDFFGGADTVNDPYANLRKYFEGVGEEENAAKTTSGNKTLLEKYYGRPDYTAGQKSLDAFILGGQRAPVDQGREALTQARTKYESLGKELGDLSAGAKQKSQDEQSQYRNLLGINEAGNLNPYDNVRGNGLIQDVYEGAQEKANQAQLGYGAKKQQIQSSLSGQYDLSKLDPALASELGFTGDRGLTYGVDPGRPDYLDEKIAQENISPSSVASQQDLARMKALQELGGYGGNLFDESQVGTYPGSPFQVNTNKLNSNIADAHRGYDSEIRTLGDKIGTLEGKYSVGNANNNTLTPQQRIAQLESWLEATKAVPQKSAFKIDWENTVRPGITQQQNELNDILRRYRIS